MTEYLKSIEIPTRDGSEVVEVFLDELPDDSNEICEILLAEAAPFDLFHQFAVILPFPMNSFTRFRSLSTISAIFYLPSFFF